MKSAARVQILDEVVSVSLRTDALGYGTNSSLFPFAMEKKNNFCKKPIPNNVEFTLMEKTPKKCILLFKKYSYLLNDPRR